jgi:L-asparaginase
MTDKQQNIHIIATGGTIDSKFHAPTESSKVKENSGIEQFLNNIIQPHFSYKLDQICMLDSGDITDKIRSDIINLIENSPSSKILITHGTNTMVETLEYIQNELQIKNKTIILTGSMIPMDGFCPTDGGFNLGYAIANIEAIGFGVYIAMNGKIFKPNEVNKNFKIGRFECKETK